MKRNEILKHVKALYEYSQTSDKLKNELAIAFPELRKNDDEKIRKALINVFATHKDYEVYFGVSVEDIRVWLESKGEQKSIKTTWTPSEEQIKVLDEVLTYAAQHENPYWNDYIFGTLCDLIRQLKN